MPDIFDDLKRITDQAWRFGKRLSKDDPLGPHDLADRLAAEQAGPEFAAEVIRSRYFTRMPCRSSATRSTAFSQSATTKQPETYASSTWKVSSRS